MKKLILLNPFLQTESAHSYGFSKTIHSELSDVMECTLLTHKTFNSTDEWIIPTFRANVWKPFFTIKRLYSFLRKNNTKNVRFTDLVGEKKTKKFYYKWILSASELLNITYLNMISFFDIRQAFKGTDANNTVVMAQLVHQYYIFGFWVWLMTKRVKPKIILYIELLPDQMPYKLIRWLFKNHAEFISSSDVQTKAYSNGPNWKFNGLLRNPVPRFQTNRIASNKITFGFLGTFRLSKGVDVLTDAIKLVYLDNELRNKIHFVVQCNFIVSEQQAVSKLEELKSIASESLDFITLINHPLSYEEYYQTLDSFDAMILPHRSTDIYARATSGTFIDCLMYEKLPIISDGTELVNFGGDCAIIFKRDDAHSLYECIREIVNWNITSKMKDRLSNKSRELSMKYGVQIITQFFSKYT